MKKQIHELITYKTPLNILALLLVLLIFVMPYGNEFLPPILSLSFLIWFISCFYSINNVTKELKKTNIYILPAFTIISLTSLLYSTNIYYGTKVLERMISLLILPLLFATTRNRLNFKINFIYSTLTISVLISIIALLINFETKVGFEKLVHLPNLPTILKYFRYYTLNFSLANHPSYLSYLILIYLSYSLFHIKPFRNRHIPHLIVTIISIITILALYSRGAILTLLILFLYALLKQFYLKHYLYSGILLALLLTGIYISYNYTRLGYTIQNIGKKTSLEKKDPRLIIWEHSIELIKDKPVFGYGIGDALDVLIEKHKEKGYFDGAKRRLNPHNQFFSTWLQSGLIGLISLLLIFAIPLYQSIKNRQEILFLFLTISLIQLLFESMFTRLAGIVYFSFFYSYLYYVYYAKGGEWEQEKQLTK